MSDKRCRHRRIWIIFGGRACWCYECGALRALRQLHGENASVPASGWVKPTGPGGKNPWDSYEMGRKRYVQTP